VSTTALAILASGWGIVMAVAPLLQIRRILASRSSRDVSIGFLAVYVVGFAFWLAYGLSLSNSALVVANAVSLAVGSATLVVAVRFHPRPSAAP
jgi:MtN3 and saliva related transmembrane protein